METCCSRFTPAEGGARLAAAACLKNTLTVEYSSFIATRLVYEDAYKIRGCLSDGRQRSVHVTKPHRVPYIAYELNILTDLSIAQGVSYDDVYDWRAELEKKEVLVCTPKVLKQILEDEILSMNNINVLVIECCHMISVDGDLQYIMNKYKSSGTDQRPRILGLTYPLFTSPQKKLEAIDNNDGIDKSEDVDNKTNEDKQISPEPIDLHENQDDFSMYEKLEWKIEELESALCSQMDLAEDIDGGKRLSSAVAKPKELIIQYSVRNQEDLSEDCIELERFMRSTIDDAALFIEDHRYDPTEIYGEEMFEEFQSIPDPTVEPRQMLRLFQYILDELGPYAADKAAFSLLAKLEKLKIKVPYERHFLLLCLCTTTFVKIRCQADYIFSKYTTDWDRIKLFSTPKVLRLAEILEKFQPKDSENKVEDDTKKSTNDMLDAIDKCDFKSIGDKIEDKVHLIEAGLKDLDLEINQSCEEAKLELDKSEHETEKSTFETEKSTFETEKSTLETVKSTLETEKSTLETEKSTLETEKSSLETDKAVSTQENSQKSVLGFPRRGNRARGRGRVQRNNASRVQQILQNPDALCGIVFMNDPLMAKIVFMIVADMSRYNSKLSYLSAQYCCVDSAPTGGEPGECQRQGKKHEDVLKKFRMHECNLLLATSSLEEGIDLPRCNLVLRWDLPTSYRSYLLCRGRGRAARSASALLCRCRRHVLPTVAIYAALDGIISRKCGCGIQDEPAQAEEDHADSFTSIVKPYTPCDDKTDIDIADDEVDIEPYCDKVKIGFENSKVTSDVPNCQRNSIKKEDDSDSNDTKTLIESEVFSKHFDNKIKINPNISIKPNIENKSDLNNVNDSERTFGDMKCDVFYKVENKNGEFARVDLGTAVSLINRYCGKLPSDTFTRLAPQWWMERVRMPYGDEIKDAYICTIRLPLNCPVKYNIVGHPMPTRVLAKRMVALQACRILHKSGELDNQLMPIGKENFKADIDTSCNQGMIESIEANDAARPGTTKRRQYYYKRTALAFTDCEPVIDARDEELFPNEADRIPMENPANMKKDNKRNMLYAIVCALWCALPERYNTRGRSLHAPEHATQAVAVLMARRGDGELRIPSFPVYTRSGEVRVSVSHEPKADVRMCPTRAALVHRFMQFVFSGVLRVRRRGMRLQTDGSTHNNYYIVPTIKVNCDDGTSYTNVDWNFLRLIYQHTEQQKLSEIEKPLSDNVSKQENVNTDHDNVKNDQNNGINDHDKDSEIVKKDCEIVKKDSENVKIDDDNKFNSGENMTKNEISKETTDKKDDGTKSNDQADKTNTASKDKTNIKENSKTVFVNDGKTIDVRGKEKKDKVKKMENPLLKKGEVFVFDADKYREAVVTPWYRNQDQPQFFLVAEICWNLTPDSEFPSATHESFRQYYQSKYGVELTQTRQPLLDVDHTSARLNLLTPRYVNRKGVALPVSSERTRRAKRDRLDQKQILVPELCRVHPFAAPLWFATVALPCVLYRINALLIADEIRRSVALDVGLGVPRIEDENFKWPPLDFGWSLSEVLLQVLNTDSEKNDTMKGDEVKRTETLHEDAEKQETEKDKQNGREEGKEKTINEILQEKIDAENGFEIGTWSNEMASSIPQDDLDELLEPLPPNLTFCTSASGGTNWCDPVEKPKSQFNPSRKFSMADSDCSYMSSDFDTDDSDLNSLGSDDETDTSGYCSKNANAAMGVRIEYKTSHEAEAVDLDSKKKVKPSPSLEADQEAKDLEEFRRFIVEGTPPKEYVEKFRKSVAEHEQEIIKDGFIKHDEPIKEILPETKENNKPPNENTKEASSVRIKNLFPHAECFDGQISLESIEKSKRVLLSRLKMTLTDEEAKQLNCFSMIDVDIDSTDFVNEKTANIGFDSKEKYVQRLSEFSGDFRPYYMEGKAPSGKGFDFDYQPDLEGHPGPSPSVILQALTMSNANDGINLERLETIGDSFLKFAITAYLYCARPSVHEGKLSHMRSKQVSNLNLYRLGRNKRLGTLMIASKFEPHDNWLPPCHVPPPTLHPRMTDSKDDELDFEPPVDNTGCFIPYNLITQHSIPDKSIADCVEALIGAYLLECGARGALLFMSWLGIRVLPRHHVALQRGGAAKEKHSGLPESSQYEPSHDCVKRPVGSLAPCLVDGEWVQPIFGELRAPPSPLLRYIADPDGELQQMLSGYDELERTLHYRFKDRSLLLQAMTHASHQKNRLTDCYQRLEFLGDAILDYLITRHLYEDPRRHSPGALTDLRSALVNNTIFATLAARHGFHKYFRHMSPGLNEVLTKYVKIQEENGHSISEEHYLIQEDEMEQAEDVEVPKALGDLFESVAGAIFLDSGMSLGAVWKSYVRLMGAELEAFSAAAPKSPVRELLEAEPDTAKFGKPERLADGRRVRVCVEVFGRGVYRGVGRNYRIAKCTAARAALRHLRASKR